MSKVPILENAPNQLKNSVVMVVYGKVRRKMAKVTIAKLLVDKV